MREWAILAGKGRLLLSGSVVLASLKAAVNAPGNPTETSSQLKIDSGIETYSGIASNN